MGARPTALRPGRRAPRTRRGGPLGGPPRCDAVARQRFFARLRFAGLRAFFAAFRFAGARFFAAFRLFAGARFFVVFLVAFRFAGARFAVLRFADLRAGARFAAFLFVAFLAVFRFAGGTNTTFHGTLPTTGDELNASALNPLPI
jgi:hypothetical protein